MNNDTARTTLLTTIVCLIPVIAGIILYPKLPDVIVTHWGADGEPNGWSSKFVGAILFPLGLVAVNLIFPVLLKTDPKYRNVSPKIKALIHWIIPIVCIFCSSSTLAEALGVNTRIEVTAPLLVALLFIIIGNYMPKMVPSYMVGIKLPWTLNSEENWNKTHRLAGFLWVICGFAMILMVIFKVPMILMIIPFLIMVLIPMVYSFMLYQKDHPNH